MNQEMSYLGMDVSKIPVGSMASHCCVASNDGSELNWPSSPSAFSEEDQRQFDNILYGDFDIISSHKLFDKLKDYEDKFKSPSDKFYKKWIKNETLLNLETQDWMNTYKEVFA